MANITVSSDVDTMLQSADNAEIRSNLGLADAPTFTGMTNATGSVNTPRVITRKVKGTDSGVIHYDSKEHRFRDLDEEPDDMLVIKKVDGKLGARIGINQPDAVTPPRCSLEIHHQSTDGVDRETLRVMGGSFFNEYIRVGHYATAPVDSNGDATLPVGSIIYNSTSKKFQGNVGNANGGWKTFKFEE